MISELAPTKKTNTTHLRYSSVRIVSIAGEVRRTARGPVHIQGLKLALSPRRVHLALDNVAPVVLHVREAGRVLQLGTTARLQRSALELPVVVP